MKVNPKREGRLSIPIKFDEAIKRALTVKLPSEGWAQYEKKLKRGRKRKRAESAA
jgi:hypothetical protein